MMFSQFGGDVADHPFRQRVDDQFFGQTSSAAAC